MPRTIKQRVVERGEERELTVTLPDQEVSWGDPARLRILSQRVPRTDGPEKVTGRAKYTSDLKLPGMLYGRIYRSPYASAIIEGPDDVDLSEAERIPGVVTLNLISGRTTIRYAGQEVAAVAAPTPEAAEDAVRAIRVRFRPQPFVVNEDKAVQPGAPQVRPDVDGNVNRVGQPSTRGDVDAAFESAHATSEGTYTVESRLHACLETHVNVAKWDGDRLTFWSSTQGVHPSRNQLGQRFGGRENVRVICEYMGGGFGSKFNPGTDGAICAQLAREANRPVKLWLPREEEQVLHYRGPTLIAEIRLAGDAEGRVTGAISRNIAAGGTANNPRTPMSSGFYIVEPASLRTTSEAILTNNAGTAALRAPGHPQASWVWECALDDLAAALNVDPLELRRRNHRHAVRTAQWTHGAELIGWERRNRVPGEGPANGPLRRGIGMASATWGGGGSQGTIVHVEIDREGGVRSMVGSQCIGTGTRNYVAGIVAEEFGLEIGQVQGLVGDSDYGNAGASGGSNTSPSVAPSVKMAAVDARQRLCVALASHFDLTPEQAPAALAFEGGRVFLRENPQRSLSWQEACQRLPAEGIRAEGGWNNQLRASGVAGCSFAEVEVDVETGKVRPVKIVSIQDCGFVLNLLQAESQVYGSVIQGIANALWEERVMCNQTGVMLNPNLEDYKLTGALDTPEVVVVIWENPSGRVSGVGEPPIIPVSGAIANAVFNATGARVAEAPLTPDRVLAALANNRGGAA